MTTATLPSHDAIRWILQSTPWRIIGQHHTAHPIGLPMRDGLGAYVQTERVWLAPAPLGREAIGTARAAVCRHYPFDSRCPHYRHRHRLPRGAAVRCQG
jgi:hypothetical protein